MGRVLFQFLNPLVLLIGSGFFVFLGKVIFKASVLLAKPIKSLFCLLFRT